MNLTPLFLLHGALGNKQQLAPLKAELAAHFHLLDLNFSGHGGRPLPEAYSMSVFVEDVLAEMDAAKIERAHFFGYSMGGYVALQLAQRHPEKVAQIVTLGTKFDWTPETAAREVKMLNPTKIEEKVPAFAAALQKAHQPQDWRTVLHKTADMMTALGNGTGLAMTDLATIQQPVVIGIGEQDRMVGRKESTLAADHLPNGQLLVLPETPHPIEKVNPAQLAAELIRIFQN